MGGAYREMVVLFRRKITKTAEIPQPLVGPTWGVERSTRATVAVRMTRDLEVGVEDSERYCEKSEIFASKIHFFGRNSRPVCRTESWMRSLDARDCTGENEPICDCMGPTVWEKQ